MGSVTVDDFKIGKDSRRGGSLADADRLLKLTNAYITKGKYPKKRQGSDLNVTLEGGNKGLLSAGGLLNTFYGKGSVTHVDPLYKANLVNATVEHTVFVGAGLDDCNSSGEFTGLADALYEVEIDATGTPDTFKWRKDGGAYTAGVAITGAAQVLSDGVQIKFSATTGHTLADKWSFNGKFYNSVKEIHFGDSFLGFIYAVVEYDTGYVRHHYLDGSDNTVIKDVNCPHSKGVTKMESKIWAVNGDTVRFSAVANPRDWTTASDAGFLPTGLRTKNADNAIALGQYGKHQLIVLFHDGAQLWTVDPDPALNTYEKELGGFHTQFPRSVLKFAGDLFVLGDGGVRSTTEKVFSENINEEDVGSPIDDDIKAVLTANSNVLSGRYNKLGQYWLVVDSNVFVYTFSRSAKISAWSIYDYPFTIEAMEELGGKFYLRSGNNVYLVNENTYTDNGVAFTSSIQTAYLNAKEPGQDKLWHGVDVILKGSADVSYLWDPRDPLAVTAPATFTGDTTPRQRAPIEIISPSLSFLYENSLDEDFELQSFTAYFTTLGLQ